MGHPVLGDKHYGVKRQKALITLPALKKAVANLSRHALHAAELAFPHPRSKQFLSYSTPWPDDLLGLVKVLSLLK
jgi:23S rRNA pseudouridine1911/1915/1917 synthase